MLEAEEQSPNQDSDQQLGREAMDRGMDKLAEKASERAATRGAEKAATGAGGKAAAGAAAERLAIQQGERATAEALAPETAGISLAIMAALEIIRRLPVLGKGIELAEKGIGKLIKLLTLLIVGIPGCCCSCCAAPFILVGLVIIAIFFSHGGSERANAGPGGGIVPRTILSVAKRVVPSSVPVGSSGAAATVTYTITVTNSAADPATNIRVDDSFSEPAISPISYTIFSLAAGASDSRNFPVILPNTNIERAIYNSVSISGTIGGSNYTSTATGVAFVGNPPDGPPRGCPEVATITTPYGKNIFGYTVFNSEHQGVDMDGGHLTPVLSTINGNAVHSVGNLGNSIITVTSRDGQWQVKYLHLADFGYVEGPVTVGQAIGLQDQTGYSFASHLHYEVYLGGVRQNPFTYLSVALDNPIPTSLIPGEVYGGLFPDYTGVEPPNGANNWGSCLALP